MVAGTLRWANGYNQLQTLPSLNLKNVTISAYQRPHFFAFHRFDKRLNTYPEFFNRAFTNKAMD